MNSKPVFPHTVLAVDVHVQPETGLRMATCTAIPGFTLAALSDEELDMKLLPAIVEFLEFSGYRSGVKLVAESVEQFGKFKTNRRQVRLESIAA